MGLVYRVGSKIALIGLMNAVQMPLFYIGDRQQKLYEKLKSATEGKMPGCTKTKPKIKPVAAVIGWFRKRDSAFWTAFATIVMAVFTVVLASVSYLQWRELHKQGADTEKLAKAAVATSRGWIAPEQMALRSPVESGLPLQYRIRVGNPGKEPALGVVWKVRAYGVPYISEDGETDWATFPANSTCSGLEPKPDDGLVVYPSAEGAPSYWLPLSIPDSKETRLLLDSVQRKVESLVIEGCFVYRAASQTHKSLFRFFLRDVPGSPSFILGKNGKRTAAWSFNAVLTGNGAK